MISVYAYNCKDIDDDMYREMLACVSGERRIKAGRFLQRVDSVRSVCGELMARYLFLKQYPHNEGGKISYIENACGKPSVAGYPDFHYNVSHSGDWVACAVADFEIGVDIEKIETAYLGIAKRFFSREETETLFRQAQAAQNSYFYKLWTAKESYIKCVGAGLSIPLESFSIVGDRVVKDGKRTEHIIRHYDIGADYSLSTCCKDTGEARFELLSGLFIGG